MLECSVLVSLLKPTKQSTIAEYARTVFVLKVNKELQTVERVDIVFDTYKKDSLKGTSRQKRRTRYGEKWKIVVTVFEDTVG